MIRYSEYRRYRLGSSIAKIDVVEGVNKHFDLLEIDLLEAVALPYNLNEGFMGDAAIILQMIAEEDREINQTVIREHMALCKEVFHKYMCETVDFDSYLSQGGPQGMEGLGELDKLKKRIKWAIDGFKDHIRQVLSTIVANRNAPATSNNPGSSGVTSPQTTGTPSSGNQSIGSVPQSNNAPANVPQFSQPSSDSSSGSAAPWWFRKTKTGPGWWKGTTNLAKSAVKGVWDRVKGGWRGDNLADSVRAKIVNLVENLFEQSEVDVLSTIDQWADKLYSYLSNNIDAYAKTAPAAAANVSTPVPTPAEMTPGAAAVNPAMSGNPATMKPQRAPRAAPNYDMDDKAFYDAIRNDDHIMKTVMAAKAAKAGIITPEDVPHKSLHRLNAFRKQLGLPNADKYPESKRKQLTAEEIEAFRKMSEDKLRAWAENKPGRRRINQLAASFGIPVGTRNEDKLKEIASQIYQKLQGGEQPSVVAPPTPVEEPTAPETPVAQNTMPFPKDDPTAVAPRNVPGDSAEKPLSGVRQLAQQMDARMKAGTATPNADVTTPAAAPRKRTSLFDDPSIDPSYKRPEPTPVAEKLPEEPAPAVSAPVTTPNQAAASNDPKADPHARTERLKSNFIHDLKTFENGTMMDGNKISLQNASQFALSDEDLSAIIDKVGAEKGGLANASDDDLLDAAHTEFVKRYIQGSGKSPDFVNNVIARILQDTPAPSKQDDDGDFDSIMGQMDDEASKKEDEKSPMIDQVMSHIPNQILGHLDDETVGEMKKQISKLMDQQPGTPPEVLAKKVMGLAAQMSKAHEIYNTLGPNIKDQMDPAELKMTIAEMLTTKKLQTVTCPNCEGQPGRKENCRNCRGRGQKTELASVPENMIKHKLLENIEKKKMESSVDPLTKEPEFEEFKNLWPTVQAARSELLRKVQKEQANGRNPDEILSVLKKYMADMVLTDQQSKRYDDEPDIEDDDVIPMNNDEEDWKPTEKESNSPLMKTRDILSNDRLPGSTMTYFDALNDKFQDAELVDKEIRQALVDSGSNVNKTVELLKRKVAELQTQST